MEQVAQKAAGAVDRSAVVGEAAQDVRADGAGGVTGRAPAGASCRDHSSSSAPPAGTNSAALRGSRART